MTRKLRVSPTLLCASVVSAAFVPGLAFAQADAVAPRVDISFDVAVRHDSNIVKSDAVRAAARGLTREDQRVTPALVVDIYRPFGRNSVSLVGSAGYDFHRRNQQLDRERIALDGGLNLAASICELNLDAGISRRQSDLGDFGFIPGVGSDATKNAETILRYGASTSCGPEIGIRPTASISRTEGDNSALLRERADYDTTTYSTGIAYRHPSVGMVQLFVSRSDTKYPNRLIGGTKDGYRLRSYGGRFEREIGSRLRGSVEVAYTDLDGRSALTRSFGGLTWNGSLTANVSPQFQLRGMIGRAVKSSLVSDSAYNVEKNYSVDGTYAINPRLSLKGGYSAQPRRYFYSGPVPVNTLTRETRHTVFSGLEYKRSERLSFYVDGGHERRTAPGTLFDYKNTFALFGVRTRF
jgi:Putative beta-barrel porin 2